MNRQVAARPHLDLGEVGLDVGEEFDPLAEVGVRHLDADQQEDGKRQHLRRMAERQAEDAHVGPGETAEGEQLLARLAGRQDAHGGGIGRPRPAHEGTQRRHEDERHQERRREGRQQGYGQELHELADDAGPEDEGQEGRQRGRRRGDDRPRHALGGQPVGEAAGLALGHLAVGVLGDHDGAVDQHADGEDQRKEHHDVDGEAEGGQHQDAGEKRARDGDPDQTRGAQAERRDDDDHDQNDGADHVVLQFLQHGPDIVGLVLGIGDVNGGAYPRLPGGALGLDHAAHRLDGFDDVLSGALLDLEGQGRTAVEAGKRFGILEGAAHFADVTEPDHGIAVDLDGQGHDVEDGLEKSRHLQGEPSLAGILGAGGDQQVAVAHDVDGVPRRQAVTLHLYRIDEDLDHLVAFAGDLHIEHRGDAFDGILQFTRQLEERALRDIARQRHQDDGEQAEIDFVELGFLGLVGQLALGDVDLLAHVVHGRVGIEPGLEFQGHGAAALAAAGAHFLDPLDDAQFLLHGADEQALGVLRRNAFVLHHHVDDGDVDVGIGFLGNLHVGDGPGDEDQDQGGDDGARAREGRIDEPPHDDPPPFPWTAPASSGTGRTR